MMKTRIWKTSFETQVCVLFLEHICVSRSIIMSLYHPRFSLSKDSYTMHDFKSILATAMCSTLVQTFHSCFTLSFIKGVHLQSLDLQGRRQRLLQLLGLGDVIDDQSVLVSLTSDLELGLLERLAVRLGLLVGLDDGGLDVSSSSQLNELLDVLNLFLEMLVH